MNRRRVVTACILVHSLAAAGCAPEGSQGANRASTRSTAELLQRCDPKPAGLEESAESGNAGSELQYRMASGRVTEAESQSYLDKTYELDLFGARRQLARTAPSWPLDGHAFVRVCPIYPVSTTEIRWRRSGDPQWRMVSHRDGFAYLDLGPPSPGPQTANIEYQLLRDDRSLWRGSLPVSYEGRGHRADGASLITDKSVAAWLQAEVQPTLDVSNRSRLAFLTLYPPSATSNPLQVHTAFRLELLRDGTAVGDTHVVFGLGLTPGSLCSPLQPLSVEWRDPKAAFDNGGVWTARLISVPELAATSEFDDFQSTNPPPRKVWCGTVEVPVQVHCVPP
jgi:hypothetical protein